MNQSKRLPDGFPRELTILLHDGVHKEQTQIWAPYHHQGKEVRLVVQNAYEKFANGGETWILFPISSPNGHVVFCKAHVKTKRITGEHPVQDYLKMCGEAGCEIRICQPNAFRGKDSWRNGTLRSVSVEGATLTFVVTDAKKINPGVEIAHEIQDFDFVVAVRDLVPFHTDYGMAMNALVEGVQYEVYLHVQLSDDDLADDYDYEPREPDPEDEERRYRYDD